MNTVRRVAGNLFSLFSGEAISSALAFVITILLARRLSDEGFGRLVFLQSIMVYLALGVDLGLGTFGAREIARQPKRLPELAGSLFSLRLLMGFGIVVPFTLIVAFWPLSGEIRWLYWASALGLLSQALNPEFAFQGSERMNGIAAWRVMVHALYLLLIFVIVTGRGKLWTVPLLRFGAEAIALVLIATWLMRRRVQLPLFTWQPAQWRSYLRESLVMAASVVVIKLYYTFDTTLLGIIATPEAVGWYQAAYKIVLLFHGATVLVQMAFAPYFARYWQDKTQMVRVMKRYALILMFIGSLASITLILVHKELIVLVYGQAYLGASGALFYLALSLYGVFIVSIFLSPLLFSGRQNKYLLFMSVAAGLNIVFNLVLIPRYSFLGAAVAIVMSNIGLILMTGINYIKEYNEYSVILLIGKTGIQAILLFIISDMFIQNRWFASLVFSFSFTFIVYLSNRTAIGAIFATLFKRAVNEQLS